MPIEAKWLLPEQIIYLKTTGSTTIDDMNMMFDQINQLLDSTDQPLIHLLIDGSDAQIPKFSIQDIRSVFSDIPNTGEIGWTIVVTPSSFLRFLGTLAMQFIKMRNRQVATIEDALRFLADNDERTPSYDKLLLEFKKLSLITSTN